MIEINMSENIKILMIFHTYSSTIIYTNLFKQNNVDKVL